MSTRKTGDSCLALLSRAVMVVVVAGVVGSEASWAQTPAPPIVPQGAIVMWEGDTAPPGWCILDGTDSRCPTPDLSDRFIMGASSVALRQAIDDLEPDAYLKGEATTLTTEANGDHVHELYLDGGVVGGPGSAPGMWFPLHAKQHAPPSIYRDNVRGSHTHEVRPENITPEHYKLMFIKKL